MTTDDTWLSKINMLELSPVKHPANKKRKIHQKSKKKSTEDPMVTEKALQEYLTKAALPEDAANVIKSIVEAMTKSKGDLADELLGKVRKGIADLMGFGAQPEEVSKAKETIEKAKAKTAEIKEVLKAAVEKLQGEKPPLGEVVNSLSELAGVTPTLKMLDDLPPAMKAEWEAMQKSADINAKALAELKKSIAERDDKQALGEMITKAATDLQHVPAKTEDIGNMLHLVTKTDAKAGEGLLALLKSVDEIVRQSAALSERGSSLDMLSNANPALSEMQAKADELFQKSAGKLTKEQAFAKALELFPELYTEHRATG